MLGCKGLKPLEGSVVSWLRISTLKVSAICDELEFHPWRVASCLRNLDILGWSGSFDLGADNISKP